MVGVSQTQARLLLNSHLRVGIEVTTTRYRYSIILLGLVVVYCSLYPFHNGLKKNKIKGYNRLSFLTLQWLPARSLIRRGTGCSPIPLSDAPGPGEGYQGDVWPGSLASAPIGRDANKLIHALFQRDAMKMLHVEHWWVFMVLHLRSNSALHITVGVEFEGDAEVKNIKNSIQVFLSDG